MSINIVPLSEGRFEHTFSVAKQFRPLIVGKKRAVCQRIENETNTKIHIPLPHETKDISIIGCDRAQIILARQSIDEIVKESRKKIRFTHFLSIPLNVDNIIETFNAFKSDVMTNCGAERGVEEAIFQDPKKMHLTIVMLLLLDDKEKEEAINAFHYCKQRYIDPTVEQHGPIKIQLEGVNCMNDNYTKARVIYAKVNTNDGILEKLVNDIADHFIEAGLSRRERDVVKLHVTLMNASFKERELYVNRWGNKITFDAEKIINKYKDTTFGDIVLNQIHISELHTKDTSGYYGSLATMNLSQGNITRH